MAIQNFGRYQYLTANVAVTNSTALVALNDLAVTLAAGKRYRFKLSLMVNDSAAGGLQIAFGGTCTVTTMRAQFFAWNNGTGALQTTSRMSGLAAAANADGNVSGHLVVVEGAVLVNAAGTLIPQFAQKTAAATASTVLAESSTIEIELID